MTETPNQISETVKVLMVFAKARKIQKYALELDDFVTENLLNLNFDSADLKFASLYDKLVKFLCNREITGVSRKAGAGDPKDPAVFSTEVFQTELNRAIQRRENNMRQKEFKKKKLLERNYTRDFGKARSETDKSGRGGPPKRKVWFCNVHGNQTDHSTEWCPTLHPELLQKKAKFIQARYNPLHRIKTEEPETEANVTLSKKSEARDARFDWG